MRNLLALAAFTCMGTALAADSSNYQLRDTADLVTVCSVGPDNPNYANAIGFCHGVLTGAFRYYEATAAHTNRFVCAPTPTPTRTKVMNDFVIWARSHPAEMKAPPIDTLFKYLAQTYPCKS
jgi:hypothetical protein